MKFPIPIIFVALLLVAVPIQAAQTTPTLSYDNTDLTTGTTRTISVTVAGSGSAATISSLTLSTSCLTVSDPPGGSYNSFSAATGGTTKDFVVTSGTAGSCTFSASSLEQGQVSPATSADGTLVFVDPSSVGTTIDVDPAGTYSSGANYTFTATINNPLNDTISIAYNITSASGTTKQTGDAESDTLTLTAGSETELNFSYASTASDTLYFYVGDNLAHSAAITISATSSSSSGGGGGSSSSTTTVSIPTVTYVISTISSVTGVTKNPVKDGLPVTALTVKVKNTVTDVTLQLKGLTSKPSDITTPSADYTVYQYIEMNTVNLANSNVEEAMVTFDVNASWFTDNNIDKNKVTLLRNNNGTWEAYAATLKSETASKKTYTTTFPGFSAFAISGEKTTTTGTSGTPTPNGTDNETLPLETHNQTNQTAPGVGFRVDNPTILYLIIGAIIVIVIIGAVVLFATRGPKRK